MRLRCVALCFLFALTGAGCGGEATRRVETKVRLNSIKSRQPWRPVAPVVLADRFDEFFLGPKDSLWMTYAHIARAEHRQRLLALTHPDGSTRAQVLAQEHDPELHRWLSHFATITGYPVLVNTSFNRGGEPLVESPFDALRMFLDQHEIDYLVLGP